MPVSALPAGFQMDSAGLPMKYLHSSELCGRLAAYPPQVYVENMREGRTRKSSVDRILSLVFILF
jgi:hypothetical protein